MADALGLSQRSTGAHLQRARRASTAPSRNCKESFALCGLRRRWPQEPTRTNPSVMFRAAPAACPPAPASSSAVTDDAPSGHPGALVHAPYVHYMTVEDLGPPYDGLIVAWHGLEIGCSFCTGRRSTSRALLSASSPEGEHHCRCSADHDGTLVGAVGNGVRCSTQQRTRSESIGSGTIVARGSLASEDRDSPVHRVGTLSLRRAELDARAVVLGPARGAALTSPGRESSYRRIALPGSLGSRGRSVGSTQCPQGRRRGLARRRHGHS